MVAFQPLRQTGGEALGLGPDAPGAILQPPPETMSLNIGQVRELISRNPNDVDLLSRLARDPRVTVRRMAYRALGRGGRNLAANEDLFREGDIHYIAGADEAGRGALAGPLAAAAVVFEPGFVIKGVKDSKMLTPDQREEIYEVIVTRARRVAVVFIDSGTIDSWGLQRVNITALENAVLALEDDCHFAICDHFKLAGLPVPSCGIPKADEIFHSVAAASIVAKVERDRVMRSLDRRFPSYNFVQNKGYATGEHLSALASYGPCKVHRRSFSGVLPDDEIPLWEM
ncbi:MAG: ribonuclease HII [Actinomycetota bacterium]